MYDNKKWWRRGIYCKQNFILNWDYIMISKFALFEFANNQNYTPSQIKILIQMYIQVNLFYELIIFALSYCVYKIE